MKGFLLTLSFVLGLSICAVDGGSIKNAPPVIQYDHGVGG